MKQSIYEAAIEYAKLGFSVFPLKPNSKKPATSDGFKSASTDPVKIKKWFDNNKGLNLGIATVNFPRIDGQIV